MPSLKQYTLLIIDDMPDNVRVLYDFLKGSGFKILVAYDGKDGIETVEYAKPDLILLDIMMPGLNGFEVCQYLKTQPNTQHIPIIFMTALSDPVDKIKGFELGAADYVTKPFHQEELLARIRAHLNLYRLQQQLLAEISTRQQIEASLRDKIMELDAFAYTVAHDLKNPLTGVIGLTEVLIQTCPTEVLPPKWTERLNMVEQAGKQMLNIINAVLLLAGLSRQTDVVLQPLNMSAIVEQVQQRLETMTKTYQGAIILPHTWPATAGYAPWVEEIWANYLSNALKYGGQPPLLELGATVMEDEKQVRLWVRDNGPGLTIEAQSQLFTPFTRLHTKRAEGHGLGLSIVQRIAEKLGGTAGVESVLGQGSLFYFTLPVLSTSSSTLSV